MRITLTLVLSLLVCSPAYAGKVYNSDTGVQDFCVTVGTEDGSTSVICPDTIKFPNGNVTDNGDGSLSIADNTSVGGGNSLYVSIDSAAVYNNSSADMTLNFDTGFDFSGSGQVRTLSLDPSEKLADATNDGFMPANSMASIDTLVIASHDAVTLAGTPDYLTLSGQEITRGQIDLTTDVTGVLPDANVANNITIDLAATATALAANGGNCSAGSYPLGVDASGAVESCTDATTEIDSAISTHSSNDSAHHAPVTITGQNYLSLSTQQITAGLISLVSHVTGALPSANINWTDVDAGEIQSAGINWTDIVDRVGNAQVNWDDLTYLEESGRLSTDALDTITDISSGLKTGSDSKLVTGTAGSTNDCAKWDANGDLISAGAACGSGSGGGPTNFNIPIISAKLTGAFVVFTPPTADACSQAAQIDGGDGNWRLLFDASTDECAAFQFVMPDNYSSAPILNVDFSMTSGTANEVEFEGAIMCTTPSTDTADVGTASFSNVATGTPTTVASSAGRPYRQSITLNDDSCAAGDDVWVSLSTDANDATNDDATGDREVFGVSLSYS